MPNSTAITNSTSSAVFTINSQTGNGLTPSPPSGAYFLGLPIELWVAALAVAAFLGFYFFKYQVKGVPVGLLYMKKNFSALNLRARYDINGIFVDVLNARGKQIEKLKKEGEGLEVDEIPVNAKAYIIEEQKKGLGMDDGLVALLEQKGFRVEDKTPKPGKKKVYLAKFPETSLVGKVYLDTRGGGLKHSTLFATVEGSCKTIDFPGMIRNIPVTGQDTDAVLHEEEQAAKDYLHLLAEAGRDRWSTLLLPLIAGFGMGASISIIVLLLSGHFK